MLKSQCKQTSITEIMLVKEDFTCTMLRLCSDSDIMISGINWFLT